MDKADKRLASDNLCEIHHLKQELQSIVDFYKAELAAEEKDIMNLKFYVDALTEIEQDFIPSMNLLDTDWAFKTYKNNG